MTFLQSRIQSSQSFLLTIEQQLPVSSQAEPGRVELNQWNQIKLHAPFVIQQKRRMRIRFKWEWFRYKSSQRNFLRSLSQSQIQFHFEFTAIRTYKDYRFRCCIKRHQNDGKKHWNVVFSFKTPAHNLIVAHKLSAESLMSFGNS